MVLAELGYRHIKSRDGYVRHLSERVPLAEEHQKQTIAAVADLVRQTRALSDKLCARIESNFDSDGPASGVNEAGDEVLRTLARAGHCERDIAKIGSACRGNARVVKIVSLPFRFVALGKKDPHQRRNIRAVPRP